MFSLDNESKIGKKWAISTLSSYGFRVFSLVFTLLSTKLLLKNIGISEFGILSIFTTIISTLSFADLGLGYYFSLVWPEIRQLKKVNSVEFVTTLFFLSCVSFILILIVLLFWLLPTNYFLGGDLNLFKYKEALSVVILITALSLPSTLMQRIYFAEQNGFFISIVNSTALIISMLLLLIGIKLKSSISFFVFAIYGMAPIIWFFLLIKYLVKNELDIYNLKSFISKVFLKKSFLAGISYFIVQVSNILLNSVGIYYVTTFCGVYMLTTVNILIKLTQVLLIPFEGISSNFLPAMNVSLASKNIEWVKKKYTMLLKGAFFYGIIFFGLILFFGNNLLKIWLNDSFFEIDDYLLLAVAIFFVFRVFESVISNVMSSKILLFYLRWLYPVAAILTLTLMYFGVNKYSLIGYFIVFALCMSIFYLIPAVRLINKRLFKI